MKKTPQELAKKRAVERRNAWRELRGNCAPTGWLSDDTLETADNIPLLKGVTVSEIRRAVRLANAAPDLLATLVEMAYEVQFALDNGNATGSRISASLGNFRDTLNKHNL